MRFFASVAPLLGCLLPLCSVAQAAGAVANAAAAAAEPFVNVKLTRTINLLKSYPRETIAAEIENTSDREQEVYQITFPPSLADKIGLLQVKDTVSGRTLDVTRDAASEGTYNARLNSPLRPAAHTSLSISYTLLRSLRPLPRAILQDDPHYVTFTFAEHIPTAYHTKTQSTRVTLPRSSHIASHSAATRDGSTLKYGPYTDIAANHSDTVELSVRYEHTAPLPRAALLTRTLTVSHAAAALAVDDAYSPLHNDAASLTPSFSRVAWTLQAYHHLPVSAITSLPVPAGRGARAAWFVDDVGNVSTSHFRGGDNGDGSLELRPRYPVFGGWQYGFRVGWEAPLAGHLTRSRDDAREFLLRAPLAALPRVPSGLAVDELDLRVVLPAGADVLSWEVSPIARSSVVGSEIGLAQGGGFLDGAGRPEVQLRLHNVVDEMEAEVLVRYRLTWANEVLRKPGMVAAAVGVVLGLWAVVRRVDVSIAGKR